VTVVELVVAGLLALGGIRSLVVWSGRTFESTAVRDHVLFALHRTGRIGLWFSLAGFFLGYALLDEPQEFRWYFIVPLALAALQLVTSVLLARTPE
jgi:hypothetical protein